MEIVQRLVFAVLVVLLTGGLSLASVPLNLPLQGVIRDNAGVPVVEDVFQVAFSLYGSADAVDPVWTESWPPGDEDCTVAPESCVHVVNGRFRLALGTHSPLDVGVVEAASGLWLGMSVEGEPELPRRPLGSTPYALLASRANVANTAAGLDCTGCIAPEALSNDTVLDLLDTTLLAVQNAGYVHEGDLAAGVVPFDGASSEIAASDVQGAIEELKTLIEDKTGAGAGGVNEGAGQVVAFQMSESVPSYGTATQYVHLVNPSTPKVVTHLYGTQAAGAGGAGNLVVAYNFAPNQYSAGATGDAGDDSLHVSNPSLFNTGNHIMVHQTVGGSGTTEGTWELNQVLSVNGNNLLLVKDLEHTFVTDGTAKAQVVLAASFGTFEVVGGGVVGPAAPLAPDGSFGGITYIRANQISVKNGGVIHADASGFTHGVGLGAGGTGSAACSSSGGGGNQSAGGPGAPGDPCQVDSGAAGDSKADDASILQMGGTGGDIGSASGGSGGGLVVLGAKTVIVENGARISASGGVGAVAGAGGGAGGTVAMFTELLQNEGDISVAGGSGGERGVVDYVDAPRQIDTVNMDTHSHGGGYSPYHDEFWYPEWAGTTVYRHSSTTYQQLGTFNAPETSIMGLWGMPDGGYLISQWGGSGYVYRVPGPGESASWQSQAMQHDSGGACFDGQFIWSMDNYDSALYQLNPDNGDILDSFNLPNINGESQGALICTPGRLYRMDTSGCMRIYDIDSKGHIETECAFIGAHNTAFDGRYIYVSPNNSNVQKIEITTSNVYAADGGDGGVGWVREQVPVPGVVNESFPKGVRLLIDGNDVTASVGDPNGKGADVYDPNGGWGSTGLDAWSSGPLDVTNVANWTLGEHTLQLKENGGAGGQLKAYTYVIYPFTESTPPVNDTCSNPVGLDPNDAPVVISATTEDTMGKTLATDASNEPGCGGLGGPDVVYRVDLNQRSLLSAAVVAPFPTRLYLRAGSCVSGSQVYCADGEFTTNPIDAGSYYLFVDSNAPVAKGDFTLAVSTTPAELPPNDGCEAAEDLAFDESGAATVNASSLYALDQIQGYCSPQNGGPDVFYRFDVPAPGGMLNVTATGGFDPVVILMKDNCDANDQFLCNPQGQLVNQYVQAGSYWLAIDGPAEKAWGDYTLSVTLE